MRKQPIKGFTALIKYYDEPRNADPKEVFIAQTLDVDEDHPQYDDVFFFAGDFPEERIRKDFAYKPNDSAEEWYIMDKVDGCGCMNSPPCLGCAPESRNRKPIGYMFKSGLCCPSCTDSAYEIGELVRANPPEGKTRTLPTFDGNSLPTDMVTTNNEAVKPVFADGYPDGYTCDDCGRSTKTYLPDHAKDLSDVPVDPDANRLNLYAVWTINSDTSETEKVYFMALHEEGAACLYHQSRARDHGNILCEVVVSKVADAEVCDG